MIMGSCSNPSGASFYILYFVSDLFPRFKNSKSDVESGNGRWKDRTPA